jgi:hypothetical protein
VKNLQRSFILLFMLAVSMSASARDVSDILNKHSNFSGPIEDPSYNASIDSSSACIRESGSKPAPEALKKFLIEILGEPSEDPGDYGINSNECGSFHGSGRALDWQPGPSLDVELGNQVVDWLTKNNGEIARRMGIVQIIWTPYGEGDSRYGIWRSYNNPGTWSRYQGDGSHQWHVHFSFGGNADLATSFWQQDTADGRTASDALLPELKNTPVILQNANSNKCLGIYGGGIQNGAVANQSTCIPNNASAPSQRWIIEPKGAGYNIVNYPTMNTGDKKCLSVNGDDVQGAPLFIKDGAHFHLWSCLEENHPAV